MRMETIYEIIKKKTGRNERKTEKLLLKGYYEGRWKGEQKEKKNYSVFLLLLSQHRQMCKWDIKNSDKNKKNIQCEYHALVPPVYRRQTCRARLYISK